MRDPWVGAVLLRNRQATRGQSTWRVRTRLGALSLGFAVLVVLLSSGGMQRNGENSQPLTRTRLAEQSSVVHHGIEAAITNLEWKGRFLELTFSLRVIRPTFWLLKRTGVAPCFFWDKAGRPLPSNEFLLFELDDNFIDAAAGNEKVGQASVTAKQLLVCPRDAQSVAVGWSAHLLTRRVAIPRRPK